MDTKEWLRKNSPILGFYAPSGVGKTTLLSTLFEDDDYWPVLYVDYDEGSATIAKYANNPKLCDYRSKSKRPAGQSTFEWFARTLTEARTSKHRAIIVEGITRFRDDEVSEWFVENPEAVNAPRGVMKAYAKPSQLSSALYGVFSKIKDDRLRSGTGCPLIYTMNVNEVKLETKPPVQYYKPALSHNLIENLMGRSDVFAEITRGAGMPLRVLPNRTTHNGARKARNATIAKALANMVDPSLTDLFDVWARVEQQQTDETEAWATDEDETPDTDTDTE